MVRRLSLVKLRDVPLANGDNGTADEVVPVDATLRDALDAVLRSRTGRVQVRDDEKVVGTVDADTIRRASQ